MNLIATNTIGAGGNDAKDPLFEQAVKVVRENNHASISLVQRSFLIGYNRSARLLEAMEVAGVVTPIDSMGLREVVPV